MSEPLHEEENHEFYMDLLDAVPGISFLTEPKGYSSNRWLSCVLIDEQKAGSTAEEVRLHLEQDNIESRPLWKPMHLQPLFESAPYYGQKVAATLFDNRSLLTLREQFNGWRKRANSKSIENSIFVLMFERIFKYHYSNKFAYALDALCIWIALEALLFLNGAALIIRTPFDKPIFIALALLQHHFFRGYKMVLRFTTFIDIGKITSGLILTIVLYALYIKADTRGHYNYLLLCFILVYRFCRFIVWSSNFCMPALPKKKNYSIPCFLALAQMGYAQNAL